MNQTPNNPNRVPAGLTPLVQMFPMHIGEDTPARAETTKPDASKPATPVPGRNTNRAG